VAAGMPVLADGMFFVGLDLHTDLVPSPAGVPVPALIPHTAAAPLRWMVPALGGRYADDVLTPTGAVVLRGSDVGPAIPHCPMGPSLAMMLGFIIAGSSSKSPFGVSSVRAGGGATPVAVGVLFAAGVQQDCGDAAPGVPMLIGRGLTPCLTNSSVQAGFTLADLGGALFAMWFDSAFEWGLGTVTKWVAKGFLKWASKSTKTVIPFLEKMFKWWGELWSEAFEEVVDVLIGWGFDAGKMGLPDDGWGKWVNDVLEGDYAFDTGHDLVDALL
jgi:hypothetical protein